MFDQTLQAQVIPFREFDGVFLMKKQSTKLPGAEHYGVLISGEPLRFLGLHGCPPVVIHRTSEMKTDWAETTGSWQVIEQVRPDQTQPAVARARAVFNDPNYYLLTNNCEHTARYIISGQKLSTQVGQWLGIALLLGAAIYLVNQREN